VPLSGRALAILEELAAAKTGAFVFPGQRHGKPLSGNASHALGISRTTIYNLAATGKIRLIKIGGRTLVPESEIDRLVEGAA
jgi:excisionase family DNA binding protein